MASMLLRLSSIDEDHQDWQRWAGNFTYNWKVVIKGQEWRVCDASEKDKGKQDIKKKIEDVLIIAHGAGPGERFLIEMRGVSLQVAKEVRIMLADHLAPNCKFRVQICFAGTEPAFLECLVPSGVTAFAPNYYSYLSSIRSSRRAIDLKYMTCLHAREMRILMTRNCGEFHFKNNFNQLFLPNDNNFKWVKKLRDYQTSDAGVIAFRDIANTLISQSINSKLIDLLRAPLEKHFSDIIVLERENLVDYLWGGATCTYLGRR